jgi:hypothetical protein
MSKGKTRYQVTLPDGRVESFERGGEKIEYVVVSHATDSANFAGSCASPAMTEAQTSKAKAWHVSSMHKSRKSADTQLANNKAIGENYPQCGGWEYRIASVTIN